MDIAIYLADITIAIAFLWVIILILLQNNV